MKGQKTGLMLAAEKGLEDQVNVLLELGANVDLKNSLGLTALTYAIWAGQDNVVSLLIDRSDKINYLLGPVSSSFFYGKFPKVSLIVFVGTFF